MQNFIQQQLQQLDDSSLLEAFEQYEKTLKRASCGTVQPPRPFNDPTIHFDRRDDNFAKKFSNTHPVTQAELEHYYMSMKCEKNQGECSLTPVCYNTAGGAETKYGMLEEDDDWVNCNTDDHMSCAGFF